MNTAMYKQYENKSSYDQASYVKFYSNLQVNKADWCEFLPKPSENITDNVVLRMKHVDADVFGHAHIPNTRLFMLKNEIKNGAFYGFASTTFFEFAKGIFEDQKKWLKPENDFKVYIGSLQSGEKVKVIEFQYRDEQERLTLLKSFLKMANLIGKTNFLMNRWDKAQAGKIDLQQVIHRFGNYADNMLRASGVELYTSEFKVAQSPYHAFSLIESSKNLDDFLKKLNNFNINMERLVEGFEEFFVTFNMSGIDCSKATREKVSRPIYID